MYFRFFGKKRLTDEELARFTELDFVHQVALVATLGVGQTSASSASGATSRAIGPD